MNDPPKLPPPPRRARFGRVRGYLFTWLLAAFAIIGVSLFDFTKKVVAHELERRAIGGYVLFGAFISLLSLPILFLLRVVPENSPSSGVRLVRRVVFGVLCGLLLGGLLAAAIACGGSADATTDQMLAPLGAIFGLIAGLVDSIALDDAGRASGDDEGDAGSGGPAS